jgi:tetratricopeptide (TPR) repeat protein
MDSTERLAHNMKDLHVVPLLGCHENAFVFKKQRAHELFFTTWRSLRGSDLPQLAPVAEGFDIDGPVDESKDVGQLIANRQYQMAVTKCSRLLRLHPNRAELLVHRSLALIAMGKDADALIDVEKALAIDKVDEVIKLRDALLRRMGISGKYLDAQRPWDDSRPMPPTLFAVERQTRK